MKRPHFWQSLGYAWEGLWYTFRTQRNARIHTLVAAVVLGLALYLQLDVVRCSILVLTIGGVIAAELLNTAIEAVVDLLSPEFHAQAKIAKDVAAGAVLILGLTAIVVGMLLLGPPLCELVSRFFLD